MIRTQIYLTPEEKEGLSRIAEKSGTKQSQLIRNAIDEFLFKYDQNNWKEKAMAYAGCLREKNDCPDFSAVRGELDRL